MREKQVEQRYSQEAKRVGGMAIKFVSPGMDGMPDRLILLPGARIAFSELKAPGKPLEPLQRKWCKDLLALGHRHYKIDSEADIERFIREVMPK